MVGLEKTREEKIKRSVVLPESLHKQIEDDISRDPETDFSKWMRTAAREKLDRREVHVN